MRVTVRIDDDLHRRAKIEAARRGVTLSRFMNDALARELRRGSAGVAAEQRPHVRSGLPSG